MYTGYPMLKAEKIIKEKSGLSVYYHQYTANDIREPHWHNYYTIDVVLSGEGIHHLNGQDYRIQRGDISLIRPTDIHYLSSHTEMEAISIRFIDRAIAGEYQHLVHHLTTAHRLNDEDLALVNTCCKAIERCNKDLSIQPENKWIQDELLISFHLILVLFARQNNAVPTASGNRSTQVIQYLNMHFREPIPQQTIAEAFDLNPTYFSAWFKKNVGTSYTKYITNCRIEYACSMLKSGYSVIESCFESGFTSLSNFNHAFKKAVGKSPREYKCYVSKMP
jgi:AraC-like DNA-binding protein